jgi:hypothetical protein
MSYLRATTALCALPRRARTLTAIAVIALVTWPAGPANAEDVDKSIIGQWKLTAVLDSSEITAIDDAQAQKLVGKVLRIGADKVQLGERVCKNPDFEVTRAETNEYFARSAHASAEKLGLPNPVTAVHLNCTYVYKKAPNKLVVHWKGFFFDAVKLQPGEVRPQKPRR